MAIFVIALGEAIMFLSLITGHVGDMFFALALTFVAIQLMDEAG